MTRCPGCSGTGFIILKDENPKVDSKMRKWEYRVILKEELYLTGSRLLDAYRPTSHPGHRAPEEIALNKLGSDGWELVATLGDKDSPVGYTFYFKREVQRV